MYMRTHQSFNSILVRLDSETNSLGSVDSPILSGSRFNSILVRLDFETRKSAVGDPTKSVSEF